MKPERPGLEVSDEGEYIGRDPRSLTVEQLAELGHEPMSPVAVIRAKCIDCCAGSAQEVRLCVAITCPNWPFRMGHNPYRKPMDDVRRAKAGARLREYHASKANQQN